MDACLHIRLVAPCLALCVGCARPSPPGLGPSTTEGAVELPVLLYGDFGACAYCAPDGDVCAPRVIDCPTDVAAGRVTAFDAQRPQGKEAWVRLREHWVVGDTCTFVPDRYCPQWNAPNVLTPPCEGPPSIRVPCAPVGGDAKASVEWQWDSLSRFFGGPVAAVSPTVPEPQAAEVREGSAFAAYAVGAPVRVPAAVLPRAGGRCMQYPEFACQPVTLVSPPYSVEGFCPAPPGVPAPCSNVSSSQGPSGSP